MNEHCPTCGELVENIFEHIDVACDADQSEIQQDFEKWMIKRSISTAKDKDAWGRPKYAHSHVQAMWEGYAKAKLGRVPESLVG